MFELGRKVHDKEDLKELGDVQSGLVPHTVQCFLLIAVLYPIHTVKQTWANVFKIHVIIARRLLDVC